MSVSVSVIIDASAKEIWASLEDVGSHVEWMADAESIEFTTDKHTGVGTAFTCVTKVGPIRLTDLMTITEWEPASVMGVRHSGLVTGTGALHAEGAPRRADPVLLGRRAAVPVVDGRPAGGAGEPPGAFQAVAWQPPAAPGHRRSRDCLRDLTAGTGQRGSG